MPVTDQVNSDGYRSIVFAHPDPEGLAVLQNDPNHPKDPAVSPREQVVGQRRSEMPTIST